MSRRSKHRGTRLNQQKRVGNVLQAGLGHLPGTTLSSWRDDRLPKVLWAALLTAQLDRDEYLKLFRDISRNCAEHADVNWQGLGHSKLSKLNDDQFDGILKPILEDKYLNLLSPLGLFQTIPDAHHWSRHIVDWPNISQECYSIVAAAIGLNSWHQSETATDLRWLRVVSLVEAGKIQFPEHMQDLRREIIDFPNFGVMQKVRPSIRATEQALNHFEEEDTEGEGQKVDPWIDIFWEQTKRETTCLRASPKKPKRHNLEDIFRQSVSIYRAMANHFDQQKSHLAVDARLDGVFGIALYSLNIFMTMITGNSSNRIEGRILLRALCEMYITLSYLLHVDNPTIWSQYRNYGQGQAKLAYLKYIDVDDDKLPSFVKESDLEELANEDRWMEFVDIELGNWAKLNLRKMSEEAGIKEFYDRYYDWTSAFVHGHWGAVRDTVFDQCLNPLHRFHRIPAPPRVNMGNTLPDAVKILNSILDRTNFAYPSFKDRIKFRVDSRSRDT